MTFVLSISFPRPQVKMMVYRDETSLKDDDMLDIIEVELLKKPGRGLGLSIVGRRNGPGVYISDVVRRSGKYRPCAIFGTCNLLIALISFISGHVMQVKGGAAEADGRLMQGDQIFTVNGNDLRTASQVCIVEQNLTLTHSGAILKNQWLHGLICFIF